MTKIVKKILKVALLVLCAVVVLVIAVWGTLSVGKFAIYSDYFKVKSNICVNPGLNDDFICQGVCAAEEQGKILVAGYMTDKSHSRIYVVDIKTNDHYFVNLTRDGGKRYNGHAGGIATSGDTVYISNASKLFTFSLSSVLSAKGGEFVEIGAGVPVNNSASFVYCDEEYIYVGEFHHTEGNYFKEHELDSKSGVANGIISRYSHQQIVGYNGETPPVCDRIYMIRDRVQGVCFTPGGKIVLSTSFGLNSSNFYVYNTADVKNSNESIDGVPVYALGECVKQIKAPMMSEDLDYYDGRVITVYESASNKFFIGKLFFANDVAGLTID